MWHIFSIILSCCAVVECRVYEVSTISYLGENSSCIAKKHFNRHSYPVFPVSASQVAITLRGGKSKNPVRAMEKVPLSQTEIVQDMSVATAIINFVCDICPHGILPTAFGMAAGAGTGYITAPILLLGFGVMALYTMLSYGRACEATGQFTFSGIWGELVSPKSAWVVELSVVMLTYGCCVVYSAFMGDLFASLAKMAKSFTPDFLPRRSTILYFIGIFAILPLCLLDNLSALQATSFVGLLSILYTVAFVIKRSIDGTYLVGGEFFKTISSELRIPANNELSIVGPWRINHGTVTFMNIACLAFTAHYNGVQYYEELESRSISKYFRVLGAGMCFAYIVFSTVMIFGYRTFGPASQALLLNNYHRTEDKLAAIARLALGFSVLCSFPLTFAALKTSLFDLIGDVVNKLPQVQASSMHRTVSNTLFQKAVAVLLLASIITIACNQSEEDLGLVVGLIGAILGNVVSHVIPAILNLHLFSRKRLGASSQPWFHGEKTVNGILLVAGIVFMVVGSERVQSEEKLLERSTNHFLIYTSSTVITAKMAFMEAAIRNLHMAT